MRRCSKVLKSLEEAPMAPMAWAKLKKEVYKQKGSLNQSMLLVGRSIRQASNGFQVKVDTFHTLIGTTSPPGKALWGRRQGRWTSGITHLTGMNRKLEGLPTWASL